MNKETPGKALSRREFIGSCALSAAALWLTPADAAAATSGRAKTKPNILLMFTDDLGYGDIGIHGCKDIPTPNIDALAGSGVHFTDGYVTAPQCAPSRSGLFTGQYQQRRGQTSNRDKGRKQTVAMNQVLEKAGYACAGLGKLGGAMGINKLRVEQSDPLGLGQKGVEFIEKNKNRPFFLYYAPQSPHIPLKPRAKSFERFKEIKDETRRKYAAVVWEIDQAVGMMIDKLGILENTLVFFINDNGGPGRSNGSINRPLNGGKKGLMEGGIRVPFIMSWKGTLPSGIKYTHPVITLDVLPTAAAISGAKLPDGYKSDGVNLIPYLKGEKNGRPHEKLFWMTTSNRNWWAVRKGNLKLAINDTRVMLFDMKADPYEKHNLSKKQPETVKELSADLVKWLAQMPTSVPRLAP